jgi:uncharacterized membrane protein
LITAGFKPETQPMGMVYAFLTGITGVLGTLFYYLATSRGQFDDCGKPDSPLFIGHHITGLYLFA